MITPSSNLEKLKTVIREQKWNQLLEYVKPKHFIRQESGERPDAATLAQICQLLIDETTPDMVRILCLKCLGNSCLDSYEYKQHIVENEEFNKYGTILYDKLIESEHRIDCNYPHNTHFPYDGVAEWAIDYITTHEKSICCFTNNELDIFRLSIQFLSNMFTYACKNVISKDNVLKYLNCVSLKQTIMNSTQSDHKALANAACIFVHNALKELSESYFTDDEKNHLCTQLLKPIKEGFTSALNTLLYILHHPNMFEIIYNDMAINKRLDLLHIIYDKLWESKSQAVCDNSNPVLTNDAAEFLAKTFCERSDLILKTVDQCLESADPMEVILILNILGLVTSMPNYKISKNANCLIITCKYLLTCLHMMGKESDNYFTPITNLSKVAPNSQRRTISINSATCENDATMEKDIDLQDHPAFGFKTGIIKVIGNIVYKNKMCQDLFRRTDGIPLLLDCCNIDARNPLILQWTILALRNLCEENLENQEIIRNCKREGLVDNSVLQEMGLTLHEDTDGKSIRIAPLRRD